MQPSSSISPSEQPAGVRPRLPEWLRRALPTSNTFAKTRGLLSELNLNTVCQSAKCPNHWECWAKGTASFMIGGDRCTRACGFCAISTLMRVEMAQKPQALVQRSPPIMKEAVPLAQHSQWFGHLALWQTVLRFSSLNRPRVLANVLLVGRARRSHSGSRGRTPAGCSEGDMEEEGCI